VGGVVAKMSKRVGRWTCPRGPWEGLFEPGKRPPKKVAKGVCGRVEIGPSAREHSRDKKHLEVLGNTRRKKSSISAKSNHFRDGPSLDGGSAWGRHRRATPIWIARRGKIIGQADQNLKLEPKTLGIKLHPKQPFSCVSELCKAPMLLRSLALAPSSTFWRRLSHVKC
jgi:hypothetical protein